MTSIFDNPVFIAAASGWVVAQVLKTLIHMIFAKKFVAERLIGSGGMPSSHSATVCAMTTAACIIYKVDSFEFAVSLILALVIGTLLPALKLIDVFNLMATRPLPSFFGREGANHALKD